MGVSQRRFSWKVDDGVVQTVFTNGVQSTLAVADLEAQPWAAKRDHDSLDISWGDMRLKAHVHVWGDQVHVFLPEGARTVLKVDDLTHAGEGQEAAGQLTAPMPGKVLSFAVKVGDAVKSGQAVAVMEAMKMEHTLHAPADGVVTELLYAPGDQVTDGAELLRLQVVD
jgi:3-methylcrotonyl-CoA carboxylase alpha subunit